MTAPIVEYTAKGGQTDFDVPFPYLDRTHVEVRANGIRYYPTAWLSPTRLRLGSPPGDGSLVTISRNTPISGQLVKFTNGAVLTEEDLNRAVQQLLYKQQELMALYEGTLYKARVRIGEAGGVAITPEDAANQIAALVAQDQVLADFRARISDINLNAQTLLSQSLQYQETRERVLADIREERIIRATEDEALAQRIEVVEAGYEDNVAAILQEATARATADEALASLIALIGAKNEDGSAFILNEEVVKLSDGTALGTRLAGIDSAIAANAATIVAEQTARANADEALATSLNTVSTTVGNHTASISTLQSSVNGLATRWGIQLNSNGHISGVVMNNDGASSDFTILADKFRVINPANGNYIQPFIVEGGVVKIQALLAGTINADLITTGRLNVDQLIWDGDIGTNKLATSSLTQMYSGVGSSGSRGRNATHILTSVGGVVVPAGASGVRVDMSGFLVATYISGDSQYEIFFERRPSGSGSWTALRSFYYGYPANLASSYIDTPPAGTWEYRLRLVTETIDVTITQPTIIATVFKR